MADAEQSLSFFDGRPYRSPVTIGKEMDHGEEEQCLAFAQTLKAEGYPVMVPRAGESVQIG